ncbi:MAG: molybdenum cofactor guanylyltransferase [Gallionellaceae bacterium]|nr:molybdenum cofactor guanylyltransferase [Gallionellaceae bacterium]
MQLAITTVILAGGLGKRIGGAKALKPLQDKAMIGWVLDMASRQSSEVLISANDAPENYASFGRQVIADRLSGWIGPLAGLHAALHHAKYDLVACLPCDTPFLPEDLLPRLLAAASKEDADAAVAVADGKRQPVIGLYHKRVLPSLDAFLHAGGRKVAEWQNTLRLSEVVFDNAGSFANINSPDDLSQANQMAASLK